MRTTTPHADYADQIAMLTRLVNQKLDEVGRGDLHIAPDRFGFEEGAEDTTELQYIYVNFEVEKGLDVCLTALTDSRVDEDWLPDYARDLAGSLPNLDQARKSLIRYHRSVRTAARRAIKEHAQDGFQIELRSVSFKPALAFHLNHPNWRDAASYVLAQVNVRKTKVLVDDDWITVEEPSDVSDEIDQLTFQG